MSVYGDVKIILEDYLGPAADRYIKRQVSFHLEKDAEEMTPRDAVQFAEWVRSSLALLTQDKSMVDEAAKRLAQLGSER